MKITQAKEQLMGGRKPKECRILETKRKMGFKDGAVSHTKCHAESKGRGPTFTHIWQDSTFPYTEQAAPGILLICPYFTHPPSAGSTQGAGCNIRSTRQSLLSQSLHSSSKQPQKQEGLSYNQNKSFHSFKQPTFAERHLRAQPCTGI